MALSASGYGLLSLHEVDFDVYSAFSCGKPHIDKFLTELAVDYQVDLLAHTWLVFHDDRPDLVGYFTLSNDSVQLSDPEQYDLGLRGDGVLRSFPAVKIGRLAVSNGLQEQGVGTAVMRLALEKIVEGAPSSAARMVVVDADNDPKVIRFYSKQGFVKSQWADKNHQNHGGKATRSNIKMLRDILVPWAI